MPCHHAICDICATILGSATRGAEYHVDLSQCPMCRRSFQLTVRQLPPTKRPVVITLDGGGIRGYITLGLLRALERRLAGAIKLPQIPDLFAGTSVGASIPFAPTLSHFKSCRVALSFRHEAVSILLPPLTDSRGDHRDGFYVQWDICRGGIL